MEVSESKTLRRVQASPSVSSLLMNHVSL